MFPLIVSFGHRADSLILISIRALFVLMEALAISGFILSALLYISVFDWTTIPEGSRFDGFTISNEIRQINNTVPIVFLTAKKLKEDVLKGYGVGGDDYITKPFDTDILLCKIKAIISRRDIHDGSKDLYEIGKFVFNSKLRTLTIGKVENKLSPKEGQLLELLAINPNALISREMALKKIWGSDDYFTARSMDVYVTKLRKYLADDPSLVIKNIHGAGYQLVITED